nr:MAG TPA: hypothetical protein [Inoviridae sp.]
MFISNNTIFFKFRKLTYCKFSINIKYFFIVKIK